MTCRDDLSPKYQGIYDKAMLGKSPKAAIKAGCLLCMSCKISEITDCTDTGCPFYSYRPYQKNPHKFSKPKIKGNLNRLHTGQIVGTDQKSIQPVQKDILIKNAPKGRLRVHIEIEPAAEKNV